MFDLFVISVIAIGAISGLCTIHTHRDYFTEFRYKDFFNGRVDSWLYVCNSVSTTACIIDLFLQVEWLRSGGCPYCDPKWLSFWLSYHLVASINAIAIHITTNKLLQKTEFCILCKEKRNIERRPK